MTKAAKSLQSWEDADLVQAIARGDQSAFAELYQRHQAAAYSMAYHIVGDRSLAEEIVQESMFCVWESAADYRAIGPVRAWLLRIVGHRSINVLQRNRRGQRKMMENEMLRKNSERSEMNADESMERDEILATLRRLTGELPALDRQLVVLYYGGGLSQSEISTALSIPQQTVSSRIEK